MLALVWIVGFLQIIVTRISQERQHTRKPPGKPGWHLCRAR